MPSRPTHAGRSSELRAGRLSEAFACYSITKVVAQREPRLADHAAAKKAIESLGFLRARGRIKLFAFCVMPDHLHVAVCLIPGHDLSTVIASFSKHTAAQINRVAGRSGSLWLEGFHDRRCRSREELEACCEYIERNPVRAGFVNCPEDWEFSSAHPQWRGVLDREWWP